MAQRSRAQIGGGKNKPCKGEEEIKKELQTLFARLVALEKA
jgi:hypothetical protein